MPLTNLAALTVGAQACSQPNHPKRKVRNQMDQLNLTLVDDEVTLLQCALYEYIQARGPTVRIYVARRYPDEHGHSEEWRRRKIIDVEARVELAAKLRGRLFNVS